MFPSLQEMHAEVGKPVLKLGTGASYRKTMVGNLNQSKKRQNVSAMTQAEFWRASRNAVSRKAFQVGGFSNVLEM